VSFACETGYQATVRSCVGRREEGGRTNAGQVCGFPIFAWNVGLWASSLWSSRFRKRECFACQGVWLHLCASIVSGLQHWLPRVCLLHVCHMSVTPRTVSSGVQPICPTSTYEHLFTCAASEMQCLFVILCEMSTDSG